MLQDRGAPGHSRTCGAFPKGSLWGPGNAAAARAAAGSVSSGCEAGGMDARWMLQRVYGADHDDPDPGPRPGHAYVELVGGALDGLLLDVTGWTGQDLEAGAALVTEVGRYGP